MRRIGTVIERDGEQLTLLFSRPESCEKCGQCSGKQHNTTLELTGDAQIGDRVEVELPSGRVAQGALLAYVLPLLLLLGGLLLASALAPGQTFLAPDLLMVLGALLGLGIGLLLMVLITRRQRTQAHFLPTIVAVYSKEKA